MFFFLKLNGSLILDFGKIFPNNIIKHQKVLNKKENAATPGQNQNKENKTPMLRSQRQKALRETKLQEIIAFSNPNTRQQYEIPTTSSRVEFLSSSRSEKAAPLKDTECKICHGKFTKQGIKRHLNSCRAKNPITSKKS